MKELTKNKLGGFFLAACAITLLTAVVRTACLFWFYEPNVGYFREGLPSVLVSLLYVLGLAVCICPLLLLPRKQLSASRNSASRTALTLRVPAVVAFFVCGIFILGNSAIQSIKLDIFTGIFCIISTLYFLFSVLSEIPRFQGRFDALRPWFCIAVIAALLCVLASAYFDTTVNINGPFTSLFLFSLLSCALFLLGEMRHDIGRPMERLHFVSGLAAFFLSASSSVGNLLFCFLGDTGVGKTISDPTRPLLLFSLSLFILARLLCFTVKKQEN